MAVRILVVTPILTVSFRSFFFRFYVVRTVHFGMKLYNDQRNAKVFNLFIYLLLPWGYAVA
jgi:hypothetical protein